MTVSGKETQVLIGWPLCPNQLGSIHLSLNQSTHKQSHGGKPDKKLGCKSWFVTQVVLCRIYPWNLGGSGATPVLPGETYDSVSLYLIVLWVSMRHLDLLSYKILNTEKLILHTLRLI